uniref:Uncharacterized protein n=1 Tax=Laticauda laticaudata TaxID=8630 RepID=A0A8C5RSP3_LATLA
MGHQQLYWSHPRNFGQGLCSCHMCSNQHGLICRYVFNMYVGFIKVRGGQLCSPSPLTLMKLMFLNSMTTTSTRMRNKKEERKQKTEDKRY